MAASVFSIMRKSTRLYLQITTDFCQMNILTEKNNILHCKHMFAIFEKNGDLGWNSFSVNYRNCSYFCLVIKNQIMVAEMLHKSKFFLYVLYSCYMNFLFVIYVIFMLYVLLYIYYIFICMLYVFKFVLHFYFHIICFKFM